MAVLDERRAFGPAHDSSNTLMGRGDSTSRIEVTDGAATDIAEGGTAKIGGFCKSLFYELL